MGRVQKGRYELRRFLVLLLSLLVSCQGYDTTTSVYGGANDDGGGTLGARSISYLVGDEETDGGIGVDVSGIFREDVDQVSMSPMMVIRWRASDYLEPYIGMGPSLVYSSWDNGDSWDLGADFRLGAYYRLGDLLSNPLWLFVEVRGLFLPVDTRVGASAGIEPNLPSLRVGHDEPPLPPPEPPPPDPESPPDPRMMDDPDDRNILELDDWTVHVVIGMGVRW